MSKNIERDQARLLRQEQGLSIIEIAEKIGVAKSSVSTWVRDVVLSPEQEEALRWNNKRFEAQKAASHTNVTKHRALRQQYQEEGRAKAREGNLLHSQGCMLYWAEGTKSRHNLRFTNSDPGMMVMYLKFLREALCVPEEKIIFHTHSYLGNNLSLEEIEDYWLNLLHMNRDQIRNSVVNNQPISSQQKGRKLIYGVGYLTVHSVHYLHHVYGAIQEYTGIDKPEWLR